MDTRFIETDASEVQTGFPKFYDKQGRFFEIVHAGQPIGFVGVRPRDRKGECELEVFVFTQCRNTLTKGTVLATLDLPKSLGFKRCVMKTSLKTVVKLLNSMGKYGIIRASVINKKHVFVRKFE